VAEQRSAFVIGGGSAGTVAGIELAKAGWQVWLAEPGGVGGTCLWAGCVPKKAIYVSSSEYRQLSRDPRFGVEPAGSSYDWQQIMAWKRHAQTTVAGDQEALIARHGIERLRGAAKFLSAGEVESGGTTYQPDAIVIATGARTVLPPLPGIDLADTSGSALAYPDVPKSLTIIGAGYIGMEFAAAYALLGTRVTLIARGPRVLPMFDEEVASVAARQLAEAGVSILTNTNVSALTGSRGAVTTRYSGSDGQSRDILSERVLVSVGRRARTEGLQLDAAGIEVDERGGLVLDEAQCTTNPNVWAAGDAAGKIQLKPAAEFAGRMVAQSIASGTPRHIDYTTIPSTVFTLPQVAQVGMTESDAAAAGIPYLVRRQTFEQLAGAVIDDVADGLIKLVFAEDGDRLIGACIAAPTASDLIYSCALGIRLGATGTDLAESMGVRAAYSEGINYAACDIS
jgi:pyruvate/2-oxoglutarate dehydrogenase complex dihydrolipoamide dehydrogenase (E3) component